MAQYRIPILAELARQLAFTPREARSAQLTAAEDFLHSLDPLKAYPTDFMIFRITGYRPANVAEDLLTGLALQHDLGLLIEEVSETLKLNTADFSEPILQIEDVTERFNVTSKTIQRWRRKGLPARRFTFPDGKRRVGFLVSSVERFFANHHEQEACGINFSQINEAERQRIVARARRLATSGRCSEKEIARRVGHRLNRSESAILHTLRSHDHSHPADAVIPLAAPEIGEEERYLIIRRYRKGIPIKSIARRLACSRAAVYRVVMEERLARINRRKAKFIDDPLYHQDDAAQVIEAIARAEDVMAESCPEESRVPRDLPPYLQALYRTALLSPARERALFLKFNFHKFQFVAARRQTEPQFVHARHLDEIESHLHKAIETKNAIVRANLRLVVSVARKHLRPGLSLMELISEGNIILMRAVEGFDLHRGYRFSTYATLALMKGFARSVPQMLANRGGAKDGMLERLADKRPRESDRFADREQVSQLLSRLNDRERAVVLAHYGIGERSIPATIDEVSEQMGLSKQRVRQIERVAIAKLREAAGAVVLT